MSRDLFFEEDKLDRILVGDKAELWHLITEADVSNFSTLTGDTNPLHMDDAYASTTPFRKRVVHGMLTASFISTIIGTKLPGEGALWYELQIRFLLPVRIGETIKVFAKVKHKSSVLRVVLLEVSIYGEDGRLVVEGEAKAKVSEPQKRKVNGMKQDKGVVIVTGGSGGIGSAICKALARDGYSILLNFSRNERAAAEIAKDIIERDGKVFIFRSDVTCGDEIKKMVETAVEEFGIVSGIVNNAALPVVDSDFLNLNWEDFQRHLDVQVKGAFFLTRSVIPYFLKQGHGNIVNITSTTNDNIPPVKWTPYSLAKAALSSFSKSLAVEYGPKNIRVNCVAPGMTQTDFVADVPEKAKMLLKMQTPLRRLAEVNDIAEVVSFLFDEKSRYISGETIRVCGGQIML